MELLTILNESRGEKPGKSDFLGACGKHSVFNAIPLSMLGFWGLFFRPNYDLCKHENSNMVYEGSQNP